MLACGSCASPGHLCPLRPSPLLTRVDADRPESAPTVSVIVCYAAAPCSLLPDSLRQSLLYLCFLAPKQALWAIHIPLLSHVHSPLPYPLAILCPCQGIFLLLIHIFKNNRGMVVIIMPRVHFFDGNPTFSVALSGFFGGNPMFSVGNLLLAYVKDLRPQSAEGSFDLRELVLVPLARLGRSR
jgi:hypothetical protein